MPGTGKKTLGSAIDEIVAALEGLDDTARLTAVRAACEHLGVAGLNLGASIAQIPRSEQAGGEAGSHVPPLASQIVDIRSLKDQKKPTNAAEMACLTAYYLDSLAPAAERKKDISSADIEKYFKQAGYPLPKSWQQLLSDAKGSGYFDSTGRGKYKLNAVGYNLVAHSLPRKKA
jgi:hypothetical protein